MSDQEADNRAVSLFARQIVREAIKQGLSGEKLFAAVGSIAAHVLGLAGAAPDVTATFIAGLCNLLVVFGVDRLTSPLAPDPQMDAGGPNAN